MNYILIHLGIGNLATSDKLWVLKDLRDYYFSNKRVPKNMLIIVKEVMSQ